MLKIFIFNFLVLLSSNISLAADFGCIELQAGKTEGGIKFFEQNFKRLCDVEKPFSIFPSPNPGLMMDNVQVCCALTDEGASRVKRESRALK